METRTMSYRVGIRERRINTHNDIRVGEIGLGDMIYARISRNGRTITEFKSTGINGMTEVLGRLRHESRGTTGLVRLYIRNHTQGWHQERPLMLYGQDRRMPVTTERKRAICPWETH